MTYRRRPKRRAAHSAPPVESRGSRRRPRLHAIGAILLAFSFVASQGLILTATAVTSDSVIGIAAADESKRSEALQALSAPDVVPSVSPRDKYVVTMPVRTRVAVSGGMELAIVNSPSSAIQWPFAASPISSGFGYRSAPCGSCSTDHQGLDFVPGTGTPVSAIADGTVTTVDFNSGWGRHVIITHQIAGQQVQSLYAHMAADSVTVSVGQAVTVGTTIGKVGNTGVSTGPHLHLEIHLAGKPTDPYVWMKSHVQ